MCGASAAALRNSFEKSVWRRCCEVTPRRNEAAAAHTGDCGGDAVEDCVGDCNGNAVEDECGVCNGSGIADGVCDCDGNILDCAGNCGGEAIKDCNDNCGGDDFSCIKSFGDYDELKNYFPHKRFIIVDGIGDGSDNDVNVVELKLDWFEGEPSNHPAGNRSEYYGYDLSNLFNTCSGIGVTSHPFIERLKAYTFDDSENDTDCAVTRFKGHIDRNLIPGEFISVSYTHLTLPTKRIV